MVTLLGGTPARTVVQRVGTANTVAGLFVGVVNPDAAPPGAPVGAAYLNRLTGDMFQLGVDMEWQFVANVKGPQGTPGPSGDGVLTPGELELIAAEVLDDLEPAVDLTIAFENALAGP